MDTVEQQAAGASRWRERFEAPQLLLAAASRSNPDRGLVSSAPDGRAFQLSGWDVTDGALTTVTDLPDGVIEGWIDPRGEWIYYLRDEGGTEHGHLVRRPFPGATSPAGTAATGPAGGTGPAEGTGPAGGTGSAAGAGLEQDLTPGFAPYTLRGVGFDGTGRLLAFNPVNEDGFALYVIELEPDRPPGEPRLLFRDSFETWGALLSARGDLAACWSTARAGGARRHTLLVFDTASGVRSAELDDGRDAGVTGVAFSQLDGDPRLLAATTRGGAARPVIWNPRTGERRDLRLDGLPADLAAGDLQPLDWSPDGRSVLLCRPTGAQRLYGYDLDTDRLTELEHPQGTYFDPIFGGIRFGPDGTLVGLRQTATRPPEVVELDGHSGRQRRVLLRAGTAPGSRPWRSVTFRSSDGTPVQAWLSVPDGAGPFPMVLDTHGGPHYAVTEFYDPISACWVDHGYAWMTVNYRGSTGFGAAFKEQIWGDVGHWEIEDMVAARAWAVHNGVARPGEVLLHGASYGGFLTLLALGTRPDLWAGGMATAAIADFAASYADESDALRALERALLGGSPEQVPERYVAASPITYADRVTAPVLVIQGRNDTRTPARQMEMYERRMRELGKRIEVHWFDAGHMSIGPALMVDSYERMLAFAARTLAASRAGR